MPVWKGAQRPEAPIFDKDEQEDIKVFYNNMAYKVNRQVINLEKVEILKKRLGECVRREGVNYLDHCSELTQRFEAAVRVSQRNAKATRKRNIGNVYTYDKKSVTDEHIAATT